MDWRPSRVLESRLAAPLLSLVVLSCAELPSTRAPAQPTASPMVAAAAPAADAKATTIRLHTAAAGSRTTEALEDAVRQSLSDAGFAVVDTGSGQDIDLVLTVVSMADSGGPARRTMLTLSPTVGGHAMEDIAGHFVRSDGGIDAVTVREICQRFKRRYLRLRGAMADGER